MLLDYSYAKEGTPIRIAIAVVWSSCLVTWIHVVTADVESGGDACEGKCWTLFFSHLMVPLLNVRIAV